MKTILLSAILSTLTFTSMADDTEINRGVVTCYGHESNTQVILKVIVNPEVSATFAVGMLDYPTMPEELELNPKEIQEASIGYQHLSFIFGHHNTVIKVMADGDIFGSESDDLSQNTPYYGKLFFQTGNSETPLIRTFDVTCVKK